MKNDKFTINFHRVPLGLEVGQIPYISSNLSLIASATRLRSNALATPPLKPHLAMPLIMHFYYMEFTQTLINVERTMQHACEV